MGLRKWFTRVAMAVLTLKSELCAQGYAWRLDEGASEQHQLTGAASHTHVLQLSEDELAVLRVSQRLGSVLVELIDPSGAAIGRFDGNPGGSLEFAVRARSSGNYQLRVHCAPEASAVEYKVALVSLAALPKQPVQPGVQAEPESPRLRALQQQPTAAEAFWKEITAHGTPLVEALDADEQLVTFLYRGRDDTRSVAVQLPVFRAQAIDGAFARLAGTDVWYHSERMPKATRLSYTLVVNADVGPNTPSDLQSHALAAATQADPLNPHSEPAQSNLPLSTRRSLILLADAEPEPWVAQRDVPHGQLRFQRWKSMRLGNERTLGLYQPPATAGPATALLLVLDGERYASVIPLPTLLDNLMAAGAIRSTAAVLVYNVTSASRVEELTCRPQFAEFLAHELLPFARAQLRAESDAAHTVLAGASLGGLSAAYTAYRHPQEFGAVLSQSGSFWFWRSDGSGKDEPDWLIERFASSDKLPIRFYLDAGVLEVGTGIGAIRDKNRRLRDVLLEKGYEVTHRELVGGHDDVSWRSGLARGLIALLAP